MIQNEYCIQLLVGCTAYMCLWNRWCAMEDEKWMLGEALKSLFPVSSISGPAMQVHCVRSNATQGNTSIYFKQASDLTKEFVKYYKKNVLFSLQNCCFLWNRHIYKRLSIFFIKNRLDFIKNCPLLSIKKPNASK